MDNYGQKKASKGKSSSSGWRDQDPTLFTKVDRVKSLSWRLFLVLAGIIVGVGGPLAYRAYQKSSAPTSNLQEIYSESSRSQSEPSSEVQEKVEEASRETAKATPKREEPPKIAPSRSKPKATASKSRRKSTRSARRSRSTQREVRTPEPTRKIAVVTPKAKPKPKPKARKKTSRRSKQAEKPAVAAAPESTTRFVTVGPVTYSVELAKRCPRKCVLLFRNNDGTILRGKFDKSDFLRTLISADGRAQVSGTLTLEDGKPWIEPISIDALAVAKPKPKPVVAKRPTPKPKAVKRAAPPEPASSARSSNRFADRIKEAVDTGEDEEEVSNVRTGRGARSLADKIRQVSSKSDDEEEEDEEEIEEKSDRPISPFQNRLRRTVNE